jgi:hypothetical protein
LRGGDALEGEVVEVAFQEQIELLAAVLLFEEADQKSALFIGDARNAIIGIAPGEIEMHDGLFAKRNRRPGRT